MSFGSSICLFLLVSCIFVLWSIRKILLLSFMAIVLANILNLLVHWLQEKGLKRGIALIITIFSTLLVLSGIFGIIIPALIQQFRELIEILPLAIEKLWNDIHNLTDYLDPRLVASLPKINTLLSQLQPLINQIAGGGLSIFYNFLAVALGLLLILALTFMILADTATYLEVFIRLFPAFYRSRVRSILHLCDRDLKAWLKGILCHMVIMTVLSWLGLNILGIPLPFSLAIMAGFLTFIPNLGPVLSVIAPLLLSFLEAPWKPPAVLILYITIYVIIQYFDTHPPIKILTVRSLDLFPAFTLLVQLFLAAVFGFLGLFLAVPIGIVARIWIQEVVIADILDNWD